VAEPALALQRNAVLCPFWKRRWAAIDATCGRWPLLGRWEVCCWVVAELAGRRWVVVRRYSSLGCTVGVGYGRGGGCAIVVVVVVVVPLWLSSPLW